MSKAAAPALRYRPSAAPEKGRREKLFVFAFFGVCLLCFAAATPLFAAEKGGWKRTGKLPRQGTVVIRSGLAWMNETAPAFQAVSRALEKELTARGLSVVPYAKPSVPEPMPETPLQQAERARTPSPPEKSTAAPAAAPAVSGDAASEKTEVLAKERKLPKLTLRSYSTPDSDANLPQSVKDVRPPDVSRALYARSQELGMPVVQDFSVPGRIPAEISEDASYADYALVVRFAAIRSWSGAGSVPAFSGTLVAAAGSSALGYGPPASPSASAPNTYGTPGGFVRGYEGAAPNDFWGRDRDFFQRDYQFKHGEPPQYAKPPQDFTPGAGRSSVPEVSGRITPQVSEWAILFLECYDLAPARRGGSPVSVWSASARKALSGGSFAENAAALAQAALAMETRPAAKTP